MQTILSKMWEKYNLLSAFKIEMNKRGYVAKDVYILQSQLDLLKEVIELESMNVLNEWLKKTYYRLLVKINKGIEYLPDLVENPEQYILNPIEKDKESWIDDEVLIFSTRTHIAVFSKISRKDQGFRYIDFKYQ